jgi:hypothetical protein
VPYGVVIVMFSGEFVQLKTSKLNLVVWVKILVVVKVPVMVTVYVPTWLTELVYHETTFLVELNIMKDVSVIPVGGVTVIE